MTGLADRCIARLGAQILVKSAQNPAGRAGNGLISPIAPDGAKDARRVSPLGTLDRDKYLLIASSAAISPGETGVTVSCGAGVYELIRLERIYIGGRLSHWEGVMRVKGG